jgi:probable addiction module antidote protein
MSADLIPFDPAEFLESEEDIAEYLTDMLASGDVALAQHALGVAVRAADMRTVCEKAGLSRDGIIRATRPTSKPRFQTVMSIVYGLGLQLQFVPHKPF